VTKTIRTLVVHTGGIGDFLLFCPSLVQLAQTGPIELLGNPDRLELAVIAGPAEAARDINEVGFDTAFSKPSDRLRAFLSRFEQVILWMQDDGALRDVIRSCRVPAIRVFPGIPPDEWARHASEYYAECLGLEVAAPFRLALPGIAPARDVVIHPGSGGVTKNWPLERFEELAGSLEDRGRHVTWCVGPAEQDLNLASDVDLIVRDRLVELAGELAAARLYVGNDSGITHLAAATGCPTLAVFGPTDPTIWAPRGDRVAVVVGKPWPTVSEVLRTLAQMGE
jgi:hypothetical protein